MMGWGGGSWLGPFGMFFWFLLLILIIAAAVWFLRRNDRSGGERPPAVRRPLALDVLEERYARGENNRDEYLQKKHDLTGWHFGCSLKNGGHAKRHHHRRGDASVQLFDVAVRPSFHRPSRT
jgi:putative membrane protein